MCDGTHYALTQIVATLPQAVPQLRDLSIRYAEKYQSSALPVTLRKLESLYIDPVTWSTLSIHRHFLEDLSTCLQNLRIVNQNFILPLITPLVGKLTHLEMYHTRSSPPFPFEVVLRDGVHLVSLRIEKTPTSGTPSVHFRRYSHALPRLKRFGVSFPPPEVAAQRDYDLFPAICDFLSNKPCLLTLELVAPNHSVYHQGLGYDRKCWDLLPTFNHLRGLSMTLTNLRDSEHCAQFIPRSVTSLALLGNVSLQTVVSMESQAYWPKYVRFLSLDQLVSDRTARRIATYVPSVYVVQLGPFHYNVVSRVTGKPVQVERWTRRTEEYFWSEQLQAQGCDDRLDYMFPPWKDTYL